MSHADSHRAALFESAEWYDRSINWDARLARELPVLCDTLGPPGTGGVLDAGAGTCRQAVALARAGYRLTAADASDQMLALGRQHAEQAGVTLRLVHAPYDRLAASVGSGFDGVYCIGNSLAAAGTAEGIRGAVRSFAAVLRPGGRSLIQIVNFPKMRRESPCVRGPRVARHEGVEYVSSRVFHFEADRVAVTNLTLWRDNGWQQFASTGVLYPIAPPELTRWLEDNGLGVDAMLGSYAHEPFDVECSDDLIVVATKFTGRAP